MSPPRRWAACCLVLSLAGAAGAQAAPVDGATQLAAPDPFELAARWTLAGLGPASVAGPVQRPAAPSPSLPPFAGLPPAAREAGVPAPGAYALMGLALLGAGLAARRLGRAQRGFSKKT